jgi:hypothetical protein
LAHLHSQRAARRTSRELALDRRKQALDQSATPVKQSWNCQAQFSEQLPHPFAMSRKGGPPPSLDPLQKHLIWDLKFLIPDFLCVARGDRTAGKPAIRNPKSQRNLY